MGKRKNSSNRTCMPPNQVYRRRRKTAFCHQSNKLNNLISINRKPTHPGIVFYEDVMKPLHLSVTRTAELLGVSRKTLSEFINEKSSLSPDMAKRISIATGTSAESWMNMQQKLSQWTAEQEKPSNDI